MSEEPRDAKEKLLEDEVHAFNGLLDEEKFDREQQLMSDSRKYGWPAVIRLDAGY